MNIHHELAQLQRAVDNLAQTSPALLAQREEQSWFDLQVEMQTKQASPYDKATQDRDRAEIDAWLRGQVA